MAVVSVNSTQPFLLWPSGSGSGTVLIGNRDETNTIIISNDMGTFIPQPGSLTDPNATYVDPLGFVVVDAAQQWYGIALAGTPQVMVLPGATYWAPSPGQIAEQISALGLATEATLLGTNAALAGTLDIFPASGFIPPGLAGTLANLTTGDPVITMTPGTPETVVAYPAPVSMYNGYEISCYGYCTSQGTAGAPLVFLISLEWFEDPVSGIPVAAEHWYCWLDRADNTATLIDNAPIVGYGNMHGQYMSITVQTLSTCTENAFLGFIYANGTQRSFPTSRWRQAMTSINPDSNGLTTINPTSAADGIDNVLAMVNGLTLAANESCWIPVGLYAGNTWLRFTNGAAPASTIVLVDCSRLRSGDLVPANGNNHQGAVFNLNNTADQDVQQFLMLPRGVCALLIENGSATSEIGFAILADNV